jgi:predicted metalloprotease with PDZ domain
MTSKNILLSVFLLVFLLITGVFSAHSQDIAYQLAMPSPHTHYFEVEIKVKKINKKTEYLDFKLPAWIPGSYMIREYAKNVDFVTASVPIKKIDKHTWRVNTKNTAEVTVKYKVYAFELTVRTSYLDDTYAYVNGASVFMYVVGMTDRMTILTIFPYQSWKQITTQLEPLSMDRRTFIAANYDYLADSPIAIGNHEVINFTAADIPHTFAIQGLPAPINKEKLVADCTKIIETATAIFGENPCKRYTFLLHLSPGASGGLEHLNSCSMMQDKFVFQQKAAYENFLGLLSHEYFHLWNTQEQRKLLDKWLIQN